ncbi:MAG: hypothetical protein QCI82_12265, partial [Candidatus Thermoplasmatota archaeon]|nr:hypothetical protein [Candidatus Thermoplasmatota archaeon]
VIYISDHAQGIMNDIFLIFDDGNISTTQIDSWLDLIECSSVTVILNGERSGLAGPDLTGPSRDIICSMGSNQTMNPDQFNITRSLEDPTADTNNDGKVSFVEAYWKEVDNLSGTGQDSVLFEGT